MSTHVIVKKRCCKSGPRCKKCPLVLKRLTRSGHAHRLSKREFVLHRGSKQAVKAARAR